MSIELINQSSNFEYEQRQSGLVAPISSPKFPYSGDYLNYNNPHKVWRSIYGSVASEVTGSFLGIGAYLALDKTASFLTQGDKKLGLEGAKKYLESIDTGEFYKPENIADLNPTQAELVVGYGDVLGGYSGIYDRAHAATKIGAFFADFVFFLGAKRQVLKGVGKAIQLSSKHLSVNKTFKFPGFNFNQIGKKFQIGKPGSLTRFLVEDAKIFLPYGVTRKLAVEIANSNKHVKDNVDLEYDLISDILLGAGLGAGIFYGGRGIGRGFSKIGPTVGKYSSKLGQEASDLYKRGRKKAQSSHFSSGVVRKIKPIFDNLYSKSEKIYEASKPKINKFDFNKPLNNFFEFIGVKNNNLFYITPRGNIALGRSLFVDILERNKDFSLRFKAYIDSRYTSGGSLTDNNIVKSFSEISDELVEKFETYYREVLPNVIIKPKNTNIFLEKYRQIFNKKEEYQTLYDVINSDIKNRFKKGGDTEEVFIYYKEKDSLGESRVGLLGLIQREFSEAVSDFINTLKNHNDLIKDKNINDLVSNFLDYIDSSYNKSSAELKRGSDEVISPLTNEDIVVRKGEVPENPSDSIEVSNSKSAEIRDSVSSTIDNIAIVKALREKGIKKGGRLVEKAKAIARGLANTIKNDKGFIRFKHKTKSKKDYSYIINAKDASHHEGLFRILEDIDSIRLQHVTESTNKKVKIKQDVSSKWRQKYPGVRPTAEALNDFAEKLLSKNEYRLYAQETLTKMPPIAEAVYGIYHRTVALLHKEVRHHERTTFLDTLPVHLKRVDDNIKKRKPIFKDSEPLTRSEVTLLAEYRNSLYYHLFRHKGLGAPSYYRDYFPFKKGMKFKKIIKAKNKAYPRIPKERLDAFRKLKPLTKVKYLLNKSKAFFEESRDFNTYAKNSSSVDHFIKEIDLLEGKTSSYIEKVETGTYADIHTLEKKVSRILENEESSVADLGSGVDSPTFSIIDLDIVERFPISSVPTKIEVLRGRINSFVKKGQTEGASSGRGFNVKTDSPVTAEEKLLFLLDFLGQANKKVLGYVDNSSILHRNYILNRMDTYFKYTASSKQYRISPEKFIKNMDRKLDGRFSAYLDYVICLRK